MSVEYVEIDDEVLDIDPVDFVVASFRPAAPALIGPKPAIASKFRMRPYQTQSIDAFWQGVDTRDEHAPNGYQRQIIVLPTGCGKTVVFATIARMAVARGWRVLILAHSDELLDQAADKLRRSTGLEAEKEKAQHCASHEAWVVVGSVQTMSRSGRLEAWAKDHFDLIVCDECHRSLADSYQKIFAHFGKAWVLGVTATPDRGDKRNLGQFYDRFAYTYSLLDACMDGWLVRPVARTIPLQIDLRGVHTARTKEGSDFAEMEVSHRIEPFLLEIARHIRDEAGSRTTVIFLPSVDTARRLSLALADLGMRADFVSGACKDRTEKIAAFKRGDVQVLCNAQLLTEGFDFDEINCVVVLRPTKIRNLFVQCIGRGTRPLSGLVDGLDLASERIAAIKNSRKPNLLILDFLWLTEKLDLIRPAHLVAEKPEVVERMLKRDGGDGDLLECKADADRDLLASLERSVRENAKKKKKTLDPLAVAVLVHDEDLKDYEPEAKWESQPATPGQLKVLEQRGINVAMVTSRGHASKLIEKINRRQELGLCTLKQLNLLTQFGVPDPALIKMADANRIITQRFAELSERRGVEVVTGAATRLASCSTPERVLALLQKLDESREKHAALFPEQWPAMVAFLANHTDPRIRALALRFRQSEPSLPGF